MPRPSSVLLPRIIASLFGFVAMTAAIRGEPPADELSSRTAILDEIWSQLAEHDPFFDSKSPELRALHDTTRDRLDRMDDPTERLRELVRMLSRLGDGHTALH